MNVSPPPSAVLTLSSGFGTAGETANLSLSINSSPGASPASIQWTFVYPASAVANFAVNASPSAIAAGKTPVCQSFTGTGAVTCVLSGKNATPIPNGPVAAISVLVSRNAPGNVTIGLAGLVGAGPDASPQNLDGAGGSIVITAPISITLTPQNPSVPSNSSEQFTAAGVYPDGSSQVLLNTVQWNSSNPSVAIVSSSGLATTGVTGTTLISATVGSAAASTMLTVPPPSLISLAIRPGSPVRAPGQSVSFRVTGTYPDGSMQDLTESANWTSSLPGVAAVTGAGRVSAVAPGSATISASYGSLSASATLTVVAPVLVSIAVTPTDASITSGASQQFTAMGTFSDGSAQILGSGVAWASSVTGVAVIGATGVATGSAPGSTTISATAGSVSGTAALTVQRPPLVSLSSVFGTPGESVNLNLSINSVSGTEPASFQFTLNYPQTAVTGIAATTGPSAIAAGKTLACTSIGASLACILSGANAAPILNGTVATVTLTLASSAVDAVPVGSTGLLAAAPNGEAENLSFSNGAISIAGLSSITLAPPSPTVPYGSSQQFTATGTYADGSVQTLRNTVNWSSSNPSVALIDSTGLAVSGAAGTTMIVAAVGSMTGSTILTTAPPPLVSLAITPASAVVPLGQMVPFHAVGTFADNTSLDMTASVAWASSAGSIATVDGTGLGMTINPGQTTITATFKSVQASTTLTVSPPVLVSVGVAPGAASIVAGLFQQFIATGTYSDRTVRDLTSAANWVSSNPAAANINNRGLATGVAAGPTTIVASVNSISGSAVLTVTQPALISLSLTPANPTLAGASALRFQAIGTYSDGSTADLSASANWSSGAPSVATVDSSGLATALTPGVSAITVTSGSLTASTSLAVANPALIEQLTANGSLLIQENFDALQISGVAQRITIGSPITVTAVTVMFQNSIAKNGYFSLDLVKDNGLGQPSNQIGDILASSSNQAVGAYPDGSFTFALPSVAVPAGVFYVVVRTGNVLPNDNSALRLVTGGESVPAGMPPLWVQNPTTQAWSVASPAQFLTFSLAAWSAANPSPVSIVVWPSNPAVPYGSTQQLAAVSVYSDGTMSDITNSAVWTSSDPDVATVNTTGLVSGLTVGASNVTASSGTMGGSTTAIIGSAIVLQQTVADGALLVQQGSQPVLFTGISQPLTFAAPAIVSSIQLQFGNSFAEDGYAYVDIVRDDGTGNPSNLPGDILATSSTAWELLGGTCTFSFQAASVPAGMVHLVLRTQKITPIGASSLSVVTGSSSSANSLVPVLIQDPSTQAWSAASIPQYLTFALTAVGTS